MGRKNALGVGFTTILLANTALGLLAYVPADNW